MTALRKTVEKKAAAAAPPAKKVAAKATKISKAAPPAASPGISRAKERAAGMRPLDPTKDSDLSLALREMIAGGETRQVVLHRIREKLASTTTRTGRTKPASTIMNHALNRATAHGYRIESSWRLVPIEGYVATELVAVETPATPADKPVRTLPKKVAKATKAATPAKLPAKKSLLRKPSAA